MERTEDIRATLAQEIARKEEELNSLRRTLAVLDTALAAAAEAHARSAAAHALSEASRAAAQAQKVENIIASSAATTPSPLQASPNAPEPTPEPVKIPPAREFKERRATPRAPGTSRSAASKAVTPAATSPVSPTPRATPVPEQIHQMMRTSPSGKYVNLKVWKAVQTLLFERAEKMSIEEIARELKAGGATLGESPVRTVATAVGYMNTKIFHVTKSNGKTLVGLMAVNN